MRTYGRLPVAAALAAGSGAVLVLAFPPYGLWWLAPIAVAALALAVRGRRARHGLWLGTLHGAVFFGWLLHWTGTYVGPGPWLLLAVFEALYLGLLAAVLAGTSRLADRLPWAWPLIVAAGWVGQEALRSRLPWGGFPWGRLAFAQADGWLLPLASLGGAPLVTFAAALLGGLLAAVVWTPRRLPVVAALAASAVLVLGAGFVVPANAPTGERVVVAVIQGNVPRLGLEFNEQRRAVLDNHVRATIALAADIAAGRADQPDLVIWPENSSDIDPYLNEDANDQISRAAVAIKVPILVGAVLRGPGEYATNAGIVWDPRTGPGERYSKRHPVPFAEYIPFRSLARRVTDKVDLVSRDFKAGDEVGVLRVGPADVGDVICFEVAYDGLVADTVNAGAQLLVVQTNNATFGKSAESDQQLAMVRLRAVEHGRYALMASTSGISATVGPDGSVRQQTGLFTQATLVDAMRLGEHRSVAARVGAIPELALSTLPVLAILGAWFIRGRGRRNGHNGRPSDVEDVSAPDAGGTARKERV